LAAVDLIFNSDVFSDLVSLYTEKFGSPPKMDDNQATWETDQGQFVLDQNYFNDHGRGGIHTQAFDQKVLEDFKAEKKAKEVELKQKLQSNL
jgi:hypothetical protein